MKGEVALILCLCSGWRSGVKSQCEWKGGSVSLFSLSNQREDLFIHHTFMHKWALENLQERAMLTVICFQLICVISLQKFEVNKKREWTSWGKAIGRVPPRLQKGQRTMWCHKHGRLETQMGKRHGERSLSSFPSSSRRGEGGCTRGGASRGGKAGPCVPWNTSSSCSWARGMYGGFSRGALGICPTWVLVAAHGACLLLHSCHDGTLVKGTRRVHSPGLIWTI